MLIKKKYTYLIVVFLIVASFAAFGRIASNDFINFDDDGYINENYHVQSGISLQNIKWIFTTVLLGNWHPVTMLSHTLDWSLFGANASGHHLISLLLHIGAVIFLFLFLNKTTNNPWSSAFAAALFALHPLRVESVAWAAERKDVLSMFFGMAALYVYAFYAENTKLSRYFLCLFLFALSLMSKAMLVTMPFVLLLLDYWPLGRWQKILSSPSKNRPYSASRLIWEKTPFFLLTITSSIITLWSQNMGGATSFGEQLSFVMRGANAIISYVAYLEKTFWPLNLAVFYPYSIILPVWKVLLSGIILIIITAVVLYYIKKLPFLFVGWFWYLGTLIPVIGLVQVGRQAIADRYTYLPSVGLAVGIAWGIHNLIKNENLRKNILFPAGLTIIILLAILSWRQCGYWKNSFELFNHTLQITKDNYVAHNNLASALLKKGKINESLVHYNEAIRLKQDYQSAYNNRGSAYYNLGQYQKAIEDYNKAISLKSDYVQAYYNRGTTYTKLSQHQQAIEDYNKAISLKSDYVQAYYNRGANYAAFGQYKLAIEDFNKAIALKSDYVQAYNSRGIVFLLQGNRKLGCADAQKACAMGDCGTLKKAQNKGDCSTP